MLVQQHLRFVEQRAPSPPFRTRREMVEQVGAERGSARRTRAWARPAQREVPAFGVGASSAMPASPKSGRSRARKLVGLLARKAQAADRVQARAGRLHLHEGRIARSQARPAASPASNCRVIAAIGQPAGRCGNAAAVARARRFGLGQAIAAAEAAGQRRRRGREARLSGRSRIIRRGRAPPQPR
jgi:hypothetical protein